MGDNCEVVIPPLPAFIPQPNLPKVIKVEGPIVPEVIAQMMSVLPVKPVAPVMIAEIVEKFQESDVDLQPAPLPDIPDIKLDASLAPISESMITGYIPPASVPVSVPMSVTNINDYIPPAPFSVLMSESTEYIPPASAPVPTAYTPPQTRFQAQSSTKSPNEYLPPLFMQRFGDDLYSDEWELFKVI